jgi:glutathione synthase/RimK-type ligase-like ATP-grasp enzyme
MMRYRIAPYKQGSKGASELAKALGGKVLRREKSTFWPHASDVIINWGSSEIDPRLIVAGVLNDPDQVRIATNKLEFLKLMQAEDSQYTPEFWTSKADIPENAYPVVCRTILSGHSGEGIVIANDASELVNAKLYVKYVKKTDEYRVHVGKEMRVIAVQRKARRHDFPDDQVNWQIRNHANGFVYVRQNVSAPACVTQAAIKSLVVSGLDFGAVDVIYYENKKGFGAKVLEINTAPGLAGQTVQDYARYFQSMKGTSNE